MYRAAGAIDDEALLSYRQRWQPLRGTPDAGPAVGRRRDRFARPGTADRASGSLSPGKRLDRLPYRVWVLTGDGELAEGSMWEAFEHAAFAGLDNLTAVIDVNRLGQTRETMHGWDLGLYARRLTAFGWHVIEVDGHDVDAIDAAYAEAIATTGRPTAIVARTIKGSGVSGGGRSERDAREAARRRQERALAELGAAHPSTDDGRGAQAGRNGGATPLRIRDARAAALRGRLDGGDAAGVCRGARGARPRPWR